MRRALACLLTSALVLLAPVAAHAGTSTRSDPDDIDGRLDIKRVALKTPGKKIVGTMRTHDAFSDDDLTGTAAMGVDFKVGKDKLRSVSIRYRNSKLRANVCTFTSDGPVLGNACSKVKVKRVNATTLRFTVARAKIAKGAKTYRWRGGSFASQGFGGCSTADWCQDTMGGNRDTWFKLKV